jgi:hypothetical protein
MEVSRSSQPHWKDYESQRNLGYMVRLLGLLGSSSSGLGLKPLFLKRETECERLWVYIEVNDFPGPGKITS